MAAETRGEDADPRARVDAATTGDGDRPGTRSRLTGLDGLRGVAILLVVVSHGWLLWPTETIDGNDGLRILFRNGNFAVTVFLFAAGFLTYRSLAAHGLARARIGRTTVRRVLRVAPITLVVLPAVLLVGAFDGDDTFSSRTNAESVWHVVTYTWNWFLQDDLAAARWDLGHLWYLSVDMQAFLFCAVVIYLLRRRPGWLAVTLTGLLLLFTWWRVHVSGIEPELLVLLRTTARIDAFVAGVLTALVVAHLARTELRPRSLTIVATTALAAAPLLAWYCSHDQRFLHWGVTLFEIDLALLVGALALGARSPRVLTAAPLVFLGRNSLPIYVWHYPVFAAVARNVPEWGWVPRALLGFALTAVACAASHYLVERRVGRMLDHPRWRREESPAAGDTGDTGDARATQPAQISK
ncbi:acyltransferase [Nocardioides marinquilinus]|uniref:Acyltransferase n=1 Tax=Nocardioides marinquilinus TaxID=1210400 RepID=A0ABP9PVQ5_9ACTN